MRKNTVRILAYCMTTSLMAASVAGTGFALRPTVAIAKEADSQAAQEKVYEKNIIIFQDLLM